MPGISIATDLVAIKHLVTQKFQDPFKLEGQKSFLVPPHQSQRKPKYCLDPFSEDNVKDPVYQRKRESIVTKKSRNSRSVIFSRIVQ
jgi:hypothetical protein